MMAAMQQNNSITLQALLKGIVDLAQDLAIEVKRLVIDSRQVQPGDLFIALPGRTVDGRQFIDKALEKGACAVLWECEHGTVPIPIAWRQQGAQTRVPVIAIEDLTHKVGVLADRYYHAPSKSLHVIGITGTNGKTSCSQFIAQAIDPYSHCAVIGTLGWGFPNKLHTSTHTTPDALRCHQWLQELQQEGAQSVAMEVSSHALDQGRVVGVHFDVAVFTNLTHDHLDYHGDMETYGQAKRKLFLLDETAHHVINVDDEFGVQLAEQAPFGKTCIRYGLKADRELDVTAEKILQTELGMQFDLVTPIGNGRIQTRIYGKFNIYNLLATAGVMLALGYKLEQIIDRMATIQAVAGRLQVITARKLPVFVIDYAHTPDALENVLLAIKHHFRGHIWCVLGCGGDRDKQKRPKMAAIAEQHAYRVVITNDNPRSESPLAIVQDMLAGMRDASKAVIELDREAAIIHAARHAAVDDIVLIAGKGHEDYQIIADRKLPFSDKAVVDKVIAEVNHV